MKTHPDHFETTIYFSNLTSTKPYILKLFNIEDGDFTYANKKHTPVHARGHAHAHPHEHAQGG